MFGAESEFKPLRKVLMHTPNQSLGRVNHTNYEHYLFMTPVFARRFTEEHQAFVDLLRGEGVRVVLIETILGNDLAALDVINRHPNLTYVRDTVSILKHGYIRMRMASGVRQAEPRICERAVTELGIPRLLQVKDQGVLEGGDFVYVDDVTLAVGVGKRTNRKGVAQLEGTVLGRCVDQLIVIPLFPWNVHLDGAFMMIDEDLALVHSESLKKTATLLQAGRKPRKIGFLGYLAKKGIDAIEVNSLERYMRGTNVVCLAPRKCVIYKWNDQTSRRLRGHGVDVLEIEGNELLRGGGGPHCMTAPILRG